MYLTSLAQTIYQRRYWEPRRLGRFLWSIAANLRGQIDLFRIFLLPAFRSLLLLDPIFLFRHHNAQFLFRGLSAGARTASVLHHYRFLISRLPNRLLHQSGHWELPLMEQRIDGRNFAVTLGPTTQCAIWEGENLLRLLVDGVPAYELQFTIVPGWVLHSSRQDVVFVQRIQGMKGRFEQIGAVTKAFSDVAPPLLLMTVLEGIAAAWGIREMACISAKSQYCNKKFRGDDRWAGLNKRAYDDFFLELGATRVTADFFSLSLPIEGKPIEAVGNGHKARTRRKRTLRREIAGRVCRTLLEAA